MYKHRSQRETGVYPLCINRGVHRGQSKHHISMNNEPPHDGTNGRRIGVQGQHRPFRGASNRASQRKHCRLKMMWVSILPSHNMNQSGGQCLCCGPVQFGRVAKKAMSYNGPIITKPCNTCRDTDGPGHKGSRLGAMSQGM